MIVRREEPDPAMSPLPPEDLPAEHRDFWHRYAGLAIEKRTLTRHTVAAFRLLCDREARYRLLGKTIEDQGLVYEKCWVDSSGQEHTELKKHPLSTEYTSAYKDVMAGLARFGLAPFGKPEAPMPKPQAANPFAALAEHG
jgi:phage terminase small subunit